MKIPDCMRIPVLAGAFLMLYFCSYGCYTMTGYHSSDDSYTDSDLYEPLHVHFYKGWSYLSVDVTLKKELLEHLHIYEQVLRRQCPSGQYTRAERDEGNYVHHRLGDFFQNQCTVRVQFVGDSKPLPYQYQHKYKPPCSIGPDRGTYCFSTEDLLSKVREYDSLRLTIIMNFGDSPVRGEQVHTKEFILVRTTRTYFQFIHGGEVIWLD